MSDVGPERKPGSNRVEHALRGNDVDQVVNLIGEELRRIAGIGRERQRYGCTLTNSEKTRTGRPAGMGIVA